MEINKNIYLIISIVGAVFSILAYFSQGEQSAITTLFLFGTVLICLKLVEEFFYYRSYRAPLASGIFLLLPSFLALGASFVSRISTLSGKAFLQDNLLNLNLDFSFMFLTEINIYLNSFSVLFAVPFYFIITILFYRYYYGIYPRLFIFKRKFFKQFAMYYNLGIILIILTIWSYYKNILLIELIFVILSIIFVVQAYIIRIILVPVRVTPGNRLRRSHSRFRSINSQNSSNPITPRTGIPISNPPRSQFNGNNRVSSSVIPSPRGMPTRNISVPHGRSSKGGTNNRKLNSITDQKNSRNHSSIQVMEGRSLRQTKSSRKVNKKFIEEILPISQNFKKDDFRCIFCYDLPIKKNDKVVICPNCKKPAHDNEYHQWYSSSPICSYCNKNVGSRKPRQISGENYLKIVNLALKRKQCEKN